MKQFILRETSVGWCLSEQNGKKIEGLEDLIKSLKRYNFSSRLYKNYLIIDKTVTKFYLFEIIEDYFEGKAVLCPF
ncbi:MAG: hypothetical protein HRT88_21495 [Lentisphaeraceae bacterium]|nr:hypothetical protein [Lentisphaeraceae bacterium]